MKSFNSYSICISKIRVLLSGEPFELSNRLSPLSRLRYNTFSIYEAINGNFFQSENTVSHNIRTFFIAVKWTIINKEFAFFFYNCVSRFWFSKHCSHTNFLQRLENVALWTSSMFLGHVGSHLAWFTGAWVLGQFLAYLEIFLEVRTEVLRS